MMDTREGVKKSLLRTYLFKLYIVVVRNQRFVQYPAPARTPGAALNGSYGTMYGIPMRIMNGIIDCCTLSLVLTSSQLIH